MTLNEWFKLNCQLSSTDRLLINKCISTFKELPKITIVTPLFNTKKDYLLQCIQSIQKQLYRNWEWCITDDCSTDSNITDVVAKLDDSRIKYNKLEKNSGIAVATNDAILRASGDWIVFMDSDDLLTENALYLIVDCINKNKEAKFIYTDELYINEKNDIVGSNFKPDWSPDLFHSNNYVNHLSAVVSEIAKKYLLRDGYNGSQDYDTLLHYFEEIKNNEIKHVQTVGYLWRIYNSSFSHNYISRTINAGYRALQEHFSRKNIDVTIFLDEFYHYRVKYNLSNPPPSVELIVLSINKNNILENCLSRLLANTSYSNYKICLCIDDDLIPLVTKWYSELINSGKIRFSPNPKDFNFSRTNNNAVKSSEADFVCFYNDDVEPLNETWLDNLVGFANQQHAGFVGCKLVFPNFTIQHAGVVLGIMNQPCVHILRLSPFLEKGYHHRAKSINNFSAVTAAVSLVKKDLFLNLGGFNDDLKVAYNDVDICLKAYSQGYYNIYNPHSLFIHYESISRGTYEGTPEKNAIAAFEKNYMVDNWKKQIANDPFYNPNFDFYSDKYNIGQQSRYKKPWLGD